MGLYFMKYFNTAKNNLTDIPNTVAIYTDS